MNGHQLVLPTITIVLPNVSILGTQAMNISIGHTTRKKLVTRSQKDYFGKGLQVFFPQKTFYMQMIFLITCF
jgi:hypothetical protein